MPNCVAEARTDGAARGEAEFTQTIPSRDRARRSQPCLAMPSAADIQRKLIATEEDKANRSVA